MAHESFEESATAQAHERVLRPGESGPGRAARRGRDLHGLRAGNHRRRRLAAHRLRGSGPDPLLRRHLFPAGRSLGTPRVHPHPRRHRRRLAGPVPADRAAPERHTAPRPPPPGGGAARTARRPRNPHHLRPGRPRGAAVPRRLRPGARRFRGGAEVPSQPAAHAAPPAPSGGGRRRVARRVPLHAPADGGRRPLRPARRRVPSLFHRCGVAGPPLREDALRQRAARRRSISWPTGSPGISQLAGGCAPRSRLDEERDAEPGRGVLFGARRRLRGRRGALLHLDAFGGEGSPG